MRPLEKANSTYGPPELCAWQVVPGVFWIQTTEPQFSRKLEKREDARRVEVTGVNFFRRTFEVCGTWRKVRRIIDRYLVSAGDQFSGHLWPQAASKSRGSIHLSGRSQMNGNNEPRDKIGFNPAARHSANQSQHGRGLPEPPVCPVPLSLCVSEVPVSAGHGPEMVLKTLAAKNACTGPNSARKRLWKLVRDLRAIEEGIGRALEIANLMVAFNEWHQCSQPFLDPAKTLEHYLAEFLAGFRKVRVPTGKGDTINKALEAVSDRSADELPVIPGMPDAPESYRRLAALHHEISRLTGGNTYFLSCRDAAKACLGLSYQLANEINRALERAGLIKIVRVGDTRPNGNATEFRYLLPQAENGVSQSEDATHKASLPNQKPVASSW